MILNSLLMTLLQSSRICVYVCSQEACRLNRYSGLASKVVHDPGIKFTKHSECSPVTFSADLADSCMSHNQIEAATYNLSLATNKWRESVSFLCGRK